jgi:hypothetical protein
MVAAALAKAPERNVMGTGAARGTPSGIQALNLRDAGADVDHQRGVRLVRASEDSRRRGGDCYRDRRRRSTRTMALTSLFGQRSCAVTDRISRRRNYAAIGEETGTSVRSSRLIPSNN